jgi:hypothetical protein
VTSPVKVSVSVATRPAVTVRIGAAVSGDAEEPESGDGDAA